jgi:L-threonylcarbamoyladenylate synthase
MRVIRLNPDRPDSDALERAAEVLRGGGLVAFPTETVYGLGADARKEWAVRGIFEAKGRPSYNPLIVHVAEISEARDLAREWPRNAQRLAERFWPGPLTLVLPKGPEIPDLVTAGLPTVAVRIPDHPVALALLQHSGLAIAAPSANRFTRVSPTRADHVIRGLGDRVDLVLDGGPTGVGIESTVLDLTGPVPVLLRPGAVSRGEIETVVGPITLAADRTGDEPRPGPGMVRRHYSPRAELRLFGRRERAAMAEAARGAQRTGKRVGALLLTPLEVPIDVAIEMPPDPAGYARLLYAALHDLDDANCEVILADAVPDDAEWTGVRDRLRRAAEK